MTDRRPRRLIAQGGVAGDGHEQGVDAGVRRAVGAHPAVAPGLGRHPLEGVPPVVDLVAERGTLTAIVGPTADEPAEIATTTEREAQP